MALLNSSSLLIYLEIGDAEPAPYFSSCFLVGLFDAPDAAQISQFTVKMKAWADKIWLARLLTPKPTIDISEPAATCKAAAYVMDNGKILEVRNVGAEQGFGPILYATVLELARARGRDGVIPSSEPGKILEKPKRIWEQFYKEPEYQGKVLTTSVSGQHPDPWLKMVYSLAYGEQLLDYKHKRWEWEMYENFWKDSNTVTGWRGHAFKMAQRSVDAHVSGAHK